MTIEHQRLSGSGYIFSASLPTFLVQACIESINVLDAKPHHKLRKLSNDFHDTLTEIGFQVQSDPDCPFKVFNVNERDDSVRRTKEEQVHEYCRLNGLHFILDADAMRINLNVKLGVDPTKYQKVEEQLKNALKSGES